MAQFIRSILGAVLFAGLVLAGLLGFAIHHLAPAEKPKDLASFTQTLRTLFDSKQATKIVYGPLPEVRDESTEAQPETKVQATTQPTVHVVLPNYVDPKALEKIRAMRIPNEMKERIIKTAQRTGQVPMLSEPDAPTTAAPTTNPHQPAPALHDRAPARVK